MNVDTRDAIMQKIPSVKQGKGGGKSERYEEKKLKEAGFYLHYPRIAV